MSSAQNSIIFNRYTHLDCLFLLQKHMNCKQKKKKLELESKNGIKGFTLEHNKWKTDYSVHIFYH